MKVRMSDDARTYLREGAKYLRKRSPAAAAAGKKARQYEFKRLNAVFRVGTHFHARIYLDENPHELRGER
jgi:plasmid stabilization system protein ParE